MRLVCPNCGAQYEVDDRVIPDNGRDVQCSNCGHTWFQRPAGDAGGQDALDELRPATQIDQGRAEAPQAAEPPAIERPTAEPVSPAADTPPEPETTDVAPQAAPADSPSPAPEADVPPDNGQRTRRTLDDDVQDVLREEAEREARVRARVRQKIETQEDLGLQSPEAAPDQRAVAAQERMARLRGLDTEEETTASGGAGARRDLLPDIEEINSSLTSIGGAEVVDEFTEPVKRGGFSRAFVGMLLLAVIAVALYLYSPAIGAKVPALAGPLETYVELVEKARDWVDQMVAMALSKLQ